MASMTCPGCNWEIPLHDTTGEPVLEQHEKWCRAKAHGPDRGLFLGTLAHAVKMMCLNGQFKGIVTCEHSVFAHPLNDDGVQCKFPRPVMKLPDIDLDEEEK